MKLARGGAIGGRRNEFHRFTACGHLSLRDKSGTAGGVSHILTDCARGCGCNLIRITGCLPRRRMVRPMAGCRRRHVCAARRRGRGPLGRRGAAGAARAGRRARRVGRCRLRTARWAAKRWTVRTIARLQPVARHPGRRIGRGAHARLGIEGGGVAGRRAEGVRPAAGLRRGSGRRLSRPAAGGRGAWSGSPGCAHRRAAVTCLCAL